jgi:hypothetical protein
MISLLKPLPVFLRNPEYIRALKTYAATWVRKLTLFTHARKTPSHDTWSSMSFSPLLSQKDNSTGLVNIR